MHKSFQLPPRQRLEYEESFDTKNKTKQSKTVNMYNFSLSSPFLFTELVGRNYRLQIQELKTFITAL